MLRYATFVEVDWTKSLPLIAARGENDVSAVLDLEPINIHPELPAAVLQASMFEDVVQ